MATRADLLAALFAPTPASPRDVAAQFRTTVAEVTTFYEELCALGLVARDEKTGTFHRAALTDASPEAFSFVVLEHRVDLSVELVRLDLLN